MYFSSSRVAMTSITRFYDHHQFSSESFFAGRPAGGQRNKRYDAY